MLLFKKRIAVVNICLIRIMSLFSSEIRKHVKPTLFFRFLQNGLHKLKNFFSDVSQSSADNRAYWSLLSLRVTRCPQKFLLRADPLSRLTVSPPVSSGSHVCPISKIELWTRVEGNPRSWITVLLTISY